MPVVHQAPGLGCSVQQPQLTQIKGRGGGGWDATGPWEAREPQGSSHLQGRTGLQPFLNVVREVAAYRKPFWKDNIYTLRNPDPHIFFMFS